MYDVLAHAYRSATAQQSVISTTVANLMRLWRPDDRTGDARNAANLVERLFFRIWQMGQARTA